MAKTKKKKETSEQNPYEVPLYTPWDVARYLRVPIWGVAALTGQPRHWIEPEFFFHHFFRGASSIVLFDDDVVSSGGTDDRLRISFRRFAALFVRAGVLQAFSEQHRAANVQSERWEVLHRWLWRGLEDTQNEPVPFDASPLEERAQRLASPFAARMDEQQGALIRKHLTIRLERVETQAGQPIRVYPPSREPVDTSTRMIEIDPKVRFGRPTLKGRGLPTDILFERHQAGDSVVDLATDYDISAAEVEEAIRYESRPSAQFLPFYW